MFNAYKTKGSKYVWIWPSGFGKGPWVGKDVQGLQSPCTFPPYAPNAVVNDSFPSQVLMAFCIICASLPADQGVLCVGPFPSVHSWMEMIGAGSGISRP